MKILDAQHPTLLSNAEVLAHLNDLDRIYEDDARYSQIPDNLQQVIRDVRSYLQIPTQPTSTKPQGYTGKESEPKYPHFTPDRFPVLAQRLKKPPYRLTPAEVLGVFNHVPRNTMELHMIIEEVPERYKQNEDRYINEILSLIEQVLVHGVTNDADLALEATENEVASVENHANGTDIKIS